MKKIIVSVICMVLIGTTAFAWTCKSSGLYSSSGSLSTSSTTVSGILCIADGTNAATCTLYDTNGQAAVGTILWKSTTAAGDYLSGGIFSNMIKANSGVYLSLGSNATGIVYYDCQ